MKRTKLTRNGRSLWLFLGLLLILPLAVPGQTTEFNFSGDTGDPGFSGVLDMEIRLYNAATDGGQVGSTAFRSAVAVEAGKFSVVLDYGFTSFPVVDRWIEVRTSPVGAGVYTILSPRSKVLSTPRAILANSAVNADQLGGLTPGQFVFMTDPRLTNARAPTAGSANYVQNTTSPQTGASFNVAGTGTVGGTFSAAIVNASTQYNLAGTRILFGQGENFFAGWSSGISNTTGFGNTAVGYTAGRNTTTASLNAMFGRSAGYSNISGAENAIFGALAGYNNNANFNSFFGSGTGRGTTTGDRNAFFGYDSGYKNTTGIRNVFVGASSGTENIAGGSNTFVGWLAGLGNTSGSNNTLLGASANVSAGNLTYATAIGSGAVVTTSGTIVIGRPVDRVEIGGLLRLSLGAAGTNHVCRNSNFELATCSSSARYKSHIEPYTSGLDLISRLRPVSFRWKQDGTPDFGLVAEEVNEVEPLLSNYNSNGEVEGVKYERVGIVLINAIKEQQAQIEDQRKQIAEQRSMIEALRKLVCSQTPLAESCK